MTKSVTPLILVVAVGCTPPAPAPVPKVLLIGIDGVRVDVLERAATPNIDALAAAGAFSVSARTRPNTVSGPGWSSMVTGVWMDKHGVEDNDLSDNDYRTCPDFLTRIEQERPDLSTLAILDWPPLGTEASGGPMIGDGIDERVNIDGDAIGYPAADEETVSAAVQRLRDGDPDAAFVYLGNADVVGHDTSSLSPEYQAAIETADRQVGELIAAVRARASYGSEDWLVLMSTDHGRRDDGGHGETSDKELTIFYLASGLSTAAASLHEPPEIVDVAVTALAHLGIEAAPQWKLDGRVNGLRAERRAERR